MAQGGILKEKIFHFYRDVNAGNVRSEKSNPDRSFQWVISGVHNADRDHSKTESTTFVPYPERIGEPFCLHVATGPSQNGRLTVSSAVSRSRHAYQNLPRLRGAIGTTRH
jgi:hypothetical protein